MRQENISYSHEYGVGAGGVGARVAILHQNHRLQWVVGPLVKWPFIL